MEKLYTCEELADRYGVESVTVRRWIRSGELGAIQVGKGYRIPQSAVDAFEKQRSTTGKEVG